MTASQEIVREFDGTGLKITPALAAAAKRRRLAANEDLFLQGDAATALFVIVSGRVRLWRMMDDGTACILLMLGAGETLACVSVAQESAHLTCATAMEPATLYSWDAPVFRAELAGHAELAGSFLRVVARRAHQLLDRFEDIAGLPVHQRVARILLREAGQYGRQDDPLAVHLALRQQDVAELAVTTVPSVSRCLARWKREGLVTVGRGTIIIRDVAAFALRAGVHID